MLCSAHAGSFATRNAARFSAVLGNIFPAFAAAVIRSSVVMTTWIRDKHETRNGGGCQTEISAAFQSSGRRPGLPPQSSRILLGGRQGRLPLPNLTPTLLPKHLVSRVPTAQHVRG